MYQCKSIIFNFSLNFIVINPIPVKNACLQILVILRCPFLATTNAIINCMNGVVKLSFGNVTLELNDSNIYKQPNIDSDEVHEVNWIKEIREERDIMSLCIFDQLEVALVMGENFLKDSISLMLQNLYVT